MDWAALNPLGFSWSEVDRARAGVFVMSVLVGLASGSNYVYSAYAPQLANQLVVGATVVNLVGLAGNFGVYMSGPLWGKIVDSRGQKLPLLLAGCFCLVGYGLVHAFYTRAIPIRPSGADLSYPRLSLLLFAMFLSGCGGSAGLTCGVNAVARSFSDNTRASATGAVLAGFGLSAFLFSGLGHAIWPGDARGLLALLAVGTSVPMLIGALVIRPVPPRQGLDGGGEYEHVEQDDVCGMTGVRGVVQDHDSPASSRTSSLDLGHSIELSRSHSPTSRTPRLGHTHSPSLSLHHEFNPDRHSLKHSPSVSFSSSAILGHSPLEIIRFSDFWLLFIILSILCGTGLMYINNVGTIALALGRDGQLLYDKEVIGGWQTKQVGLVSIWNCAGRILCGIYSDMLKTHYQVRRVWTLSVVALLFIISQLFALQTTRVESLWMVSSLLGLSYGSLFNVMPMLVFDWFGMKHFSQNWGWIAVAPVLGSNGFNVLFGKVYDAHTVARVGRPSPGNGAALEQRWTMAMRGIVRRGGSAVPGDGAHDCLVGEQCYGTAIRVSLVSCGVAFVLSVLAGLRRNKINKENSL
nr:hypothetical protein L204_01597 [Cryptococcus depauperatus CBS 7855]